MQNPDQNETTQQGGAGESRKKVIEKVEDQKKGNKEVSKEDKKNLDSRHEIYKTYLVTMIASFMIMIASLITYYFPMLHFSRKALGILNSATGEGLLGTLDFKDALMYGSYLQTQVGFESHHIYIYLLWMTVTYFLVIAAAMTVETYYSKQFGEKCLYQDLTLEFNYLNTEFDTEDKIIKLFSKLSSENVREISLVYDMSDYFKIKDQIKLTKDQMIKEPKSDIHHFRLEMLEDKMRSFIHHFHKYKKGYFQSRGFVTFKTFRVAYEVKEIYNKAIRDEKDDWITKARKKIVKRLTGKTALDTESKAKSKFRNIVLNKVMGNKNLSSVKPGEQTENRKLTHSSSFTGFFARAANVFTGATDPKLHQKIEFMKESVGKTFKIRRGTPSEDINWSYRPEAKFQKRYVMPLGLIFFIILPFLEYLFSYMWYDLAMKKFKGEEHSLYEKIMYQLTLVLMVAVDKIAYYLIEKVFVKARFLKHHQMITWKFMTTMAYLIFSNLFGVGVSLVHAGNLHMEFILEEPKKFNVNKQLVDSFYFTYYILMLSNIWSHIISPIITYVRTGKQTKRDITFGLSFLTTCLFYIAFFSPFNSSIIPIVCLALFLMVIGELCLYKFGIVTPSQICFSVIANYLTVLFLGLVPISLISLMLLTENKMGIISIRVGTGQALANSLVSFGSFCYVLGGIIFTVLYKNKRFLNRVQSKIWTVNHNKQFREPVGHSYRQLNPVYSEIK